MKAAIRACLALEGAALDELPFQSGEEALSHRVVVSVAHGSYRMEHLRLPAALPEGQADVPGGNR